MAARNDIELSRENKLAARRSAEQDVLLREVDEAVRQDQLGTAVRRHGIQFALGALVLLAAFGGWLWWQSSREGSRETASETLVTAYDALEGGRTQEATAQLAPLAKGSGSGAQASSRLALAAVALRANKRDEAFGHYNAVIADDDAPQSYRDFALIRLVSAQFEEMKPDDVIARLKPLATPGNAWFGTAGELVAMAYLKQGKNNLAGPLLAEIAKNDDVPQTLRSRTRQLSGLLGYDAVEDVDKTLAQLQQEQGRSASAPSSAAAPAP